LTNEPVQASIQEKGMSEAVDLDPELPPYFD